jgi:hypothetical protein
LLVVAAQVVRQALQQAVVAAVLLAFMVLAAVREVQQALRMRLAVLVELVQCVLYGLVTPEHSPQLVWGCHEPLH